MKKLAIIIATASLATFFAGAPVFACPHEDGAKTAEKPKDEKGTTDKAKDTKDQPKKEEGSTTAKKKEEPKKDATKKPDKVSQK